MDHDADERLAAARLHAGVALAAMVLNHQDLWTSAWKAIWSIEGGPREVIRMWAHGAASVSGVRRAYAECGGPPEDVVVVEQSEDGEETRYVNVSELPSDNPMYRSGKAAAAIILAAAGDDDTSLDAWLQVWCHPSEDFGSLAVQIASAYTAPFLNH